MYIDPHPPVFYPIILELLLGFLVSAMVFTWYVVTRKWSWKIKLLIAPILGVIFINVLFLLALAVDHRLFLDGMDIWILLN